MSKVRTNELSASTGNVIRLTNGNSLHMNGMVVQVQTATSGPTRQTISSTTPVAVDGLVIDFTPKFADSLIVVKAQIQSSLTHVSSFGIFRNGAKTIDTGTAVNNNEPDMQVTSYIGSSSTSELYSMPISWSEIAGDTLTRTYQVYATAGYTGTIHNLYINNRGGNDMAGFSHMYIMEIAQ